MSQDNKNKISENLIKLMEIMSDDSKMQFVRYLTSLCGSKGTIGELIKNASDYQLGQLSLFAAKLKYKQNPKPLMDEIVAIVKEETANK